MLVLARKRMESVVIGDGIEVTVLEVRGSSVRLGIVAPGQPIHRREVIERIQAGEGDVADLGRRVIDPLGVADAYDESTMIDHG